MDIEELDLDVKTYNRLKRDGINTTGELLSEMYKSGNDIVVSTPDAKRCEVALKNAGIIRFMRGDFAEVSDIDPKPLTWDELHGYIGKLVVHDESTESRRWLVVCWLYDVKDRDCGNAIFISRGTSFGHARRTTVNGELSRADNPNLQNEGRFFALRQGTPLETLGLSTRTYNAAVRFGIRSVEELAERISQFCAHAPNCGREAEKALNKGGKTVAENEIISENYTKAVALHRRICANAQSAQESLFEVCKGLKEMHDSKLYKELGYQNFEEYTENEVGLSRFMAYKYISIGDIKNVESIQQIGVTKLALLAKLDEPQREEIQQAVNVEEVSVRELKKRIAQLERDLKDQQGNYAMHTKRREDEIAGYKERQDKLLTRNKELVNELERTEEKLDQAENDLDEANETVQSLSRQLEELESRPRDSYEDTTKIEELKKQLAEAEERHRADLRINPTEDIKGIFKAHMMAAVDALRNLTKFAEAHENSPEKALFIEKLENVDILINQTINRLKGE